MSGPIDLPLPAPYDKFGPELTRFVYAGALNAHLQRLVLPRLEATPPVSTFVHARVWLEATAPPLTHMLTDAEREVFERAVREMATASEVTACHQRAVERCMWQMATPDDPWSNLEFRVRYARGYHRLLSLDDAAWSVSVDEGAKTTLMSVLTVFVRTGFAAHPHAATRFLDHLAAGGPTDSRLLNYCLHGMWVHHRDGTVPVEPIDLDCVLVVLYTHGAQQKMTVRLLAAAEAAGLFNKVPKPEGGHE